MDFGAAYKGVIPAKAGIHELRVAGRHGKRPPSSQLSVFMDPDFRRDDAEIESGP